MSKALIELLNNNKNGELYAWLKSLSREPKIAWYPSAGSDLRDVLYLSDEYSVFMPCKILMAQPDIYIHTDYYPWSCSNFLNSLKIFEDHRTQIKIQHLEELPPCELPLDERLVSFPAGSHATGKVIFMRLQVKSKQLGTFSARLIYAFVENTAFCAKYLLPTDAHISHIIKVRYGGGLGGGGYASGAWLNGVLQRLHCEVFVTDGRDNIQRGDQSAIEIYPELISNRMKYKMQTIRQVPSAQWSGYGDVRWQVISPV